ncbi:peptidoglycan-binding protein [Herbidospora galbida]|uniref:Peptidoglycan-binding protein n=1 Tax=Herbidospora galbida TaxID=2575442 RepID=A0A4U3MPV4_9ACTN|nr:peptidoglycan-binding domain-containing protein [Herbidospora galbida]TKK91671.1 peptidoglycan-binding protein [Herbidospora galbida]
MRVFKRFMWLMGLGLLGASIISIVIPGWPGEANDCPVLRRGNIDRPGETPCVEMLQQALRANGYPGQPVTGMFGEQTEKNVNAFKKAHGLKPDGKAGPNTFAALITPSLALPIGAPNCENGICRFVVSRDVTRQAGSRVAANHELVNKVVIDLVSLGVCTPLRATAKVSKFACEQMVEEVINDFVDTLTSATDQNACVRISAGLPLKEGGKKLRFLDFAVDSSAHCRR